MGHWNSRFSTYEHSSYSGPGRFELEECLLLIIHNISDYFSVILSLICTQVSYVSIHGPVQSLFMYVSFKCVFFFAELLGILPCMSSRHTMYMISPIATHLLHPLIMTNVA